MRAYDNANGTVDGGYREGSLGHKLHKFGKTVEKILGIIGAICLIGGFLFEVILFLIKKWTNS